jgi:ArsR family transcriptional regulator, arsenate/arsenite/antimonite-responsive transcriptional repressor
MVPAAVQQHAAADAAGSLRGRRRCCSTHPGGEACVCDLAGAFDLSQPTISHHLKVLHDSGLLDREKRGVWVYYRARTQALASLGALIGSPPA